MKAGLADRSFPMPRLHRRSWIGPTPLALHSKQGKDAMEVVLIRKLHVQFGPLLRPFHVKHQATTGRAMLALGSLEPTLSPSLALGDD